jgi:hypothetical protein
MLSFILVLLENWGFSRFAVWIASFFRETPLKQEEKAHEIEIKDAGKSDADVDKLLRDKWQR